MSRWVAGLVAALAIAAAVAGCQLTRVEEPAGLPPGAPEAMGSRPTGPIVVIGNGQSQGVAWRYSVYPSADGLCTQLETGTGASAGCGMLPDGDAVIDGLSSGVDANGATIVNGLVGDRVAEVVLLLAGGAREPVVLMSLEGAALEGQAYVGFAPPGTRVQAIVALDDAGTVLGQLEVSLP